MTAARPSGSHGSLQRFPWSNHRFGSRAEMHTPGWTGEIRWTKMVMAMRRFPRKPVAALALAFLLGNGQCVASCSQGSCNRASTSPANPETNVPPCHRHGNSPPPQSSTPCSLEVVVVADAAESPFAKTLSSPGNHVPFSAALAPLMVLAARVSAGHDRPDLSPPPNQAFLSSTVLRI